MSEKLKKITMRKMSIKRIIKTFVIFCVICLAVITIANIIMCVSVKDLIVTAEYAEEYNADCILVLGAGVRDDGTPSLMLRDRLLTAIELYKNGSASKLLMSGDHGRTDYNEVACMKSFAVEHGVPEDDIFLDHAGFSTYESVVRAEKVFGAEKVIIVTQKYHMYRALYDACAFDMECIGVAAAGQAYRGQSIRDVREVIARTKDFIFTVIKPNPTYLGESISLEGSGTVTWD